MSDDAKLILTELRQLANLYKSTEVPGPSKGGPVGLHSDGFNPNAGKGTYSVGVILEGVVNAMERKYGQ